MTQERLPPQARPDDALLERLRGRLLERVTAGGLTPAPHPPPIDGYRLGPLLGEGGMGEVWAATDGDGNAVAIKVMKPAAALDPIARRRFVGEARAVRGIVHEAIVRIFDVGETSDGRPYLVMERLEGTTLASRIAREGPLAWPTVRCVLQQVTAALATAHARGVIHRDLKSSNIMLLDPSELPRCRVIDFGLAREARPEGDESRYTRTGHLLGTPAYMSPEQFRGERADARSDIYALGCIAYEMLCGAKPFGNGSFEELFYRHLLQPVVPPSLPNVPASLHPAVTALVLRALRKRPENRFEDVDELAAALADVGTGSPPVEVPDESPWSERVDVPPRSGSRRRLLVGIALMAVGAVGWALGTARSSTESTSTTNSPPRNTTPIIDMAAGVALTCALSSSNDVQCWGSDSRGRLGRGSEGSNVGDNEYPHRHAPLAFPADRRVVELVSSADARHACARFEGGRVRCWGYNFSGELGLGTNTAWGDESHETVAALPDLPLPPAIGVATGFQNSCIIDVEQRAWCWGQGGRGVRGDGTTATVGDDERLDGAALQPVALGPRRIAQLALGREHACALLDDGSVRCWGDNAHGQLGVPGFYARIGDGIGDGHGRGERPDDPTLAVAGLHDVEVVQLRAGADRTCVLTSAGTVRCWGDNTDGFLGYAPDPAPGCLDAQTCRIEAATRDVDLGDAHIVDFDLASQHGCAVDDIGRVLCWGLAGIGRLGNGLGLKGHPENGRSSEAITVGHWVDLGDGDADGVEDLAVFLVAGDHYTCARMHTGGVRCWGDGEAGALGYASTDNIGDNETPADYYRALGLVDLPVF